MFFCLSLYIYIYIYIYIFYLTPSLKHSFLLMSMSKIIYTRAHRLSWRHQTYLLLSVSSSIWTMQLVYNCLLFLSFLPIIDVLSHYCLPLCFTPFSIKHGYLCFVTIQTKKIQKKSFVNWFCSLVKYKTVYYKSI